eukprot:403365811
MMKEKLLAVTKIMQKHAKRIPFLDKLEKKTKVDQGVILFGVLVFTFVMVVALFGLQLATLYVTVLYPGYQTLKALDSQKNETDWLVYWTIFGIFSLIEELLYFIFNIIPLYSLLRLGFFVYLWLPKTQGALVIYEMVVSPIFSQNREKLRVQIQRQNSNNQRPQTAPYVHDNSDMISQQPSTRPTTTSSAYNDSSSVRTGDIVLQESYFNDPNQIKQQSSSVITPSEYTFDDSIKDDSSVMDNSQ